MKPKPIRALCIRTAMVGGGTSYDVYFRCADKPSKPLHNGHIYATEILRGQGRYYRVEDAIDPRSHWEMPAGEEKYTAQKRLEQVAKRLAIRIARRAFPELAKLRTLPTLWATWSLPSLEVNIPVQLRLPE
jgi:hypothetical protein